MKKAHILLLLMAFAFTSFKYKDTSDSSGKNDEAFQKLADDFLKGYLDFHSQYAVSLGFHEYDGKALDLSKSSIDKEIARLNEYHQKLEQIDISTLSQKKQYDYRVLKSAIESDLFNIVDLGMYTKNPMTYADIVDVNIYIKRNFAPLEDRVRSIISIEKKAPELLADAKANLEDSLAKPYVELAIDIAKSSASFLGSDLKVALKDLKASTLSKEFNDVNDKAIAELNGYASWLEKERLPKAHNHYAIGRANYEKMLASEAIYLSPDSILAIGMKELKREQEMFNAAAKIINPNKKPVDVYAEVQKEHPTAENLIPEAKKHLEEIRQFLVDKKIVTMPSSVRVRVEEMPPYRRSTSTASMDTPGPFEKKATEAYYYITPVDSSWDAKEKEDWLSQFNYYTTDNVTIHEAYPGHYTQFLHLNASDASKIQKIFGSYPFVEGWAHYTEQMMTDEGYGGNGDPVIHAKYRLGQSGDALLRICRLCVSIKTHCYGMTVDEGTKFFMDNWYQGKKSSEQESLRGTFDPGYLFYTMGKLQILKLREDYKRQEGANFSLQKFHDQLLDNGMPQIEILREILLKDKSQWKEIL
jgi:uncharacterized protein (DUF885 family)